ADLPPGGATRRKNRLGKPKARLSRGRRAGAIVISVVTTASVGWAKARAHLSTRGQDRACAIARRQTGVNALSPTPIQVGRFCPPYIRCALAAAFSVAMILLMATPGTAQLSQKEMSCFGLLGAQPDEQVTACTAVIEAGGDVAKLAHAYCARGV